MSFTLDLFSHFVVSMGQEIKDKLQWGKNMIEIWTILLCIQNQNPQKMGLTYTK